jgi:ectoine hydroxylase-related dioxygenase (phytanoyl-CoA dioxygenase family)
MRKEAVDDRGFLVTPSIVDNRDIDCLLDGLAAENLCRSRAGVRHALRYPPVAQFARDIRLLSIAHEVLGPKAAPFRATLFDKSRASNWLVVWHQDTALPLREKREMQGWASWSVKDGVTYAHAPATALNQVLALRLQLDDSTAENGPLRVLPGTHKLGVLNDETMFELTARIKPIECLVAKGGILAMRPLLVHASSKSRSEAPRRVLHIEYAASRHLEEGLELATA